MARSEREIVTWTDGSDVVERMALPARLTVAVDGHVSGPDGFLGSDGVVYERLASWPAGLVSRPEGWCHGEPIDVPASLVPWVVARLEHHGGCRPVSAASGLPRNPGAV